MWLLTRPLHRWVGMRVTQLRRWTKFAVLAWLSTSIATAGSGGPALAATAHQSSPPPATGPIYVKDLSPTSVSLQAPLSPNGSDTTYVFDYGTTGAYGSTTLVQDAGSGLAMVIASATLSGLVPDTIYHVELVATNAGGSVTSGDQTFFTEPDGTTTVPIGGVTPPTDSPTKPVGVSERFVRAPVMNPAGSFDGFSGVSCASTFCLAVGFQGRPGGTVRPLVERWSGRSFVMAPSPKTPGASLYAVACLSSKDCLGVGRDAPNAYSARWNGHDWIVESTPSPVTANGDILRSVSCVSSADCWAAGFTDGATKNMAILIEHWNGSAWSIVDAPSPPASLANGISCSSAANCWVVGAYDAFPEAGSLLAERWNGAKWAIVPISLPLGTAGEYITVSCQSQSACWVSGSGARENFMLRFVNGSWHFVHFPQMAVMAVSCNSALACWSVGPGLAIGHWNGQAWMVIKQQTFVGGGFTSDACATATECFAVGILENQRTNSTASQRAVTYVVRAT